VPAARNARGPDDFPVNPMSTTTITRHETAARFLAALAGRADPTEYLELRYRLDDGQRRAHLGEECPVEMDNSRDACGPAQLRLFVLSRAARAR